MIKEYGNLSKEETDALVLDYQKNKSKKSLDALISDNLGFIHYVANRFVKLVGNSPDLSQTAVIGFIEGVANYKPDGGAKLTTYSEFHIRKGIYKYIRKLGVVTSMQDTNGVYQVANYSFIDDEDENVINEKLMYEENYVDDSKFIQSSFKKYFKKLTPRERQVIRERYFNDNDYSFRDIANIIGVSTTRVASLHDNAISRLRGLMLRNRDILNAYY
jgi:RNA polymerase sigma factor (sigma-70 family)